MKRIIGTLAVFLSMILAITSCAQKKQNIKPEEIQRPLTATPTVTVVLTPTATPVKAEATTPATRKPVVKKKAGKKASYYTAHTAQADRKPVAVPTATPVTIKAESAALLEDEVPVIPTPEAQPTEIELIGRGEQQAGNVLVGDMVWTPTPIAVLGYQDKSAGGDPAEKRSMIWPILLILLAIISFGFLIMRNRKKQADPFRGASKLRQPVRLQDDNDDEEQKAQLEAEERVRKEAVLKAQEEERLARIEAQQLEEQKQRAMAEENRQMAKEEPEKAAPAGDEAEKKQRQAEAELKKDKVQADEDKKNETQEAFISKVSIRSTAKRIKKPAAKTVRKAVKKTDKAVKKTAAKKATRKTAKKAAKKAVKKAAKKAVKKKTTTVQKTVTKKVVRKVTKRISNKAKAENNIIPFERKKQG